MGKMQLKKVTQRLSSLKRLMKWENCWQRKLEKKKKKEKYLTLKMQRNVTIFGTKTL